MPIRIEGVHLVVTIDGNGAPSVARAPLATRARGQLEGFGQGTLRRIYSELEGEMGRVPIEARGELEAILLAIDDLLQAPG